LKHRPEKDFAIGCFLSYNLPVFKISSGIYTEKRLMKKILYLPIETIAREFNARMLLASEAISRGYNVIIGEKHSVYKAAEILKGGIYFYKSHAENNFPKNKSSDGNDFKFLSLDEEGLVFVDDEEYLLNSKPHELDHLDIIFTWGSHQKDVLIKENPELKAKTVPIGNPRFDLLRQEFRVLYEAESREVCSRWGKYILINTNFVPGNFSRLYGCSYVESREHQFLNIIGRTPSENERDFIRAEAGYYKRLFDQYVEMIKVISAKFPGMKFILRPHPSEDIINWKEALKGLDNVHVIFKGNAAEWILGALAVIHTGCTTGIESWVLGKIVIAYNQNEGEGVEPPLPNKFGIRINNEENLCSVLGEIINEELKYEVDSDQMKIAKSYIESVDGNYSFKRFMDAIDSMFSMKNIESVAINKNDYHKLKRIENIKGAIKIKILKFLSKVQPFIKRIFGRKIYRLIYGYFDKYPGLFAQFKKFPELKSGEIKDKLSTYDEIFCKKHTNGYSIKKIATDTFLISNKQTKKP
jgi:surface carbohydrate biosynthesis protein